MGVNVKRILPDKAIDFAAPHESRRNEIFLRLIQIIEQRQLTSNFQSIISMATGEIYAYEGLIRGPFNTVRCIHHSVCSGHLGNSDCCSK